MLKNFLFSLVFISYFKFCYSQKITVFDSKTKLPISFANFSLFNQDDFIYGSYCSDKGELVIPDGLLYSKIKITCIGYENLEINKENIKNDTLLLSLAVYPLKEIVITPNKKKKLVDLGFFNSKRKTLLGASKGMKICTFIENPYTEIKRIHSFLFKIRNDNDTKLGFKLHLYEKDSVSNLPGKELLQEEIIIILDGKSKNVVEHDVTKHNIDFPANGAFVGIEWFGVLNEENSKFKGIDTQNGLIELNDVSNEFNTYQRDVFSFYPWQNLEKFKNDVKSYLTFKNSPTPSFGIKIYTD